MMQTLSGHSRAGRNDKYLKLYSHLETNKNKKMEFKLKINGSESKDAGFVGWTPVKCTLEVEGFDGRSEMPVLIRTGNYDASKGKIRLYLNNSTTSTSVDKINHDFQEKRKLNLLYCWSIWSCQCWEKGYFHQNSI